MSKIVTDSDFLTENLSNATPKNVNAAIGRLFLKKIAINVGIVVAVHYTFKKLEEKYPIDAAD